MKIHIVQKGDSLYEIAKSYGVSFEEIVKVNPQLSSPDMIMPGMKIKIPSDSKQVKNKADKAVRVEPPKTENKKQDKAVRVPVKQEKEKKVEQRKPEKTGQKKEVQQARTPERPMGVLEGDDHVKKKEVQVKVPGEHQPLYPVKPIYQAPQVPQSTPIKKPEKTEQVKKQPVKTEMKESRNVEQKMHAQTPYRPMHEAEMQMPRPMPMPMPFPQQQGPCCCCCHGHVMHHMHGVNQMSPWEQGNTYYVGHHSMPYSMHHQVNQPMPCQQTNVMPNEHHMYQHLQQQMPNQVQGKQMKHMNDYVSNEQKSHHVKNETTECRNENLHVRNETYMMPSYDFTCIEKDRR